MDGVDADSRRFGYVLKRYWDVIAAGDFACSRYDWQVTDAEGLSSRRRAFG